MPRILLLFSSVLAACTPSPQKAAMPSPSPVPGATVPSSIKPDAERRGSVAPGLSGRDAENSEPAAPRPIGEPATAETPASSPLTDSPAEALGRRILSTVFARLGPNQHLTVALHDGTELTLRSVIMRPKDYCGVQVSGARYCGGYAEIAAVRPGGAAPPDQAGLAAPNSLAVAPSPEERK